MSYRIPVTVIRVQRTILNNHEDSDDYKNLHYYFMDNFEDGYNVDCKFDNKIENKDVYISLTSIFRFIEGSHYILNISDDPRIPSTLGDKNVKLASNPIHTSL